MKMAAGERISVSDICFHVAKLLDRFADPRHPGLEEPQNAPYRYAGTSVLYRRTWQDNPALILFAFFVAGRRGTPDEVNFQMSIEFDIEAFHRDPMTYIGSMVTNVAKTIEERSRPEERSRIVLPSGGNVVHLPQRSSGH